METNNLTAVAYAYSTLKSAGLVQSKSDFSKWYLAKGSSYLRSMQARSRCIPNETVAMLEWSLKREVQNLAFNPHLGKPYALSLNAAYQCLLSELAAIQQHMKALRYLSG